MKKKSSTEFGLIKQITPEEKELKKKQETLRDLEENLANKELEFLSVKSSIQAFQDIYLRTVGLKIAELDELQAKINELKLRRQPFDEKFQSAAKEARERADNSRFAKDYCESTISPPKVVPAKETKKLFREMAKLIHPDLVTRIK